MPRDHCDELQAAAPIPGHLIRCHSTVQTALLAGIAQPTTATKEAYAAVERTRLDASLPDILALLGALAADCTTPLLEILISSPRWRPSGQGQRRGGRSGAPS
jgi:hypothetical protein